jgi:hypothetical protein
MLQFYQDLMHWYNNNDVVKRGFVSSGATANVFALKKNWNGNNAVIIANVRNSNQTFSVPLAWQGTWNDALTGSVTNLGTTITLSPYQTILLQN